MSALDTYLKAPHPEVAEAIKAFEAKALKRKIDVARTIANLIISTDAETIEVPAATDAATAAYFSKYGWLLMGSDLVFIPTSEPTPSEVALPETTEAKLEANTSSRLSAILGPVIKAVSLSSEEGSTHFLPYEIRKWHLEFFGKAFPGISFSKGDPRKALSSTGTASTLVISRPAPS